MHILVLSIHKMLVEDLCNLTDQLKSLVDDVIMPCCLCTLSPTGCLTNLVTYCTCSKQIVNPKVDNHHT